MKSGMKQWLARETDMSTSASCSACSLRAEAMSKLGMLLWRRSRSHWSRDTITLNPFFFNSLSRKVAREKLLLLEFVPSWRCELDSWYVFFNIPLDRNKVGGSMMLPLMAFWYFWKQLLLTKRSIEVLAMLMNRSSVSATSPASRYIIKHLHEYHIPSRRKWAATKVFGSELIKLLMMLWMRGAGCKLLSTSLSRSCFDLGWKLYD